MTAALFKRQDPLINKLDLVDDDQSQQLMEELADVVSPTIIAFLNQHAYNLAQQNPPIGKRFAQMTYLLRDGIGIKLACKLNGLDPKANMNGSDFIPKLMGYLCTRSDDEYQFFALGTREPWLSKGAKKLLHGRPFHAMDGFQPQQDYVGFVQTHLQADKIPVVVLAMGMPKQEEIALEIQRSLEGPALLICGGAILDFSAERFTRAPLAFRRTGLEWLYRLLKEPKRLATRYVVGIPKFFYYITRNTMSSAARNNSRVIKQES